MKDPYKEFRQQLGDLDAYRAAVKQRREAAAQMVQKQQAEAAERSVVIEAFKASGKEQADIDKFHADLASVKARFDGEKQPLRDQLAAMGETARNSAPSQRRNRGRS